MTEIIVDPVFGPFEINDQESKLIKTKEVLRLHDIKQLGLGYLVFPGASHSKFTHVMSILHAAKILCDALSDNLSLSEQKITRAFSILHCIGHGPFNYASEQCFKRLGFPSVRDRSACIMKNSPRIREILESDWQLSREEFKILYYLMKGPSKEKENFLRKKKLMFLDQLMYMLLRLGFLPNDAHYTGITYGAIDTKRILRSVMISRHEDRRLIFSVEELPLVESLFTSYYLMFFHVYLNERKRIAERMFAKALELALEMGVLDIPKNLEGEQNCRRFLQYDDSSITSFFKTVTHDHLRQLYANIQDINFYEVSVQHKVSDATLREKLQVTSYEVFLKDLENQLFDKSQQSLELKDLKKHQMLLDAPAFEIPLSVFQQRDKDLLFIDKDRRTSRLYDLSPLVPQLEGYWEDNVYLKVYTPPLANSKKRTLESLLKDVIYENYIKI